jgi:protein TonB
MNANSKNFFTMKTKKSLRANLEKKRFIFFEVGLILALAIVFCSFEYSKNQTNTSAIGSLEYDDPEDDIIAITYPKEEEKIIEPEPVKEEKVIEELTVVDNNEKESDFDINSEPTDGPIKIIIFDPAPEPVEKTEDFEYVNVETKPIFEGGDAALLKFISHTVDYPDEAVENNIEGKVYVSFIIDEKGRVVEVNALNDVHPLLNKEAERVVSLLPDWTPGKQRTIPVRVKFVLPIKFELY